jgi:HEAT repeat protein
MDELIVGAILELFEGPDQFSYKVTEAVIKIGAPAVDPLLKIAANTKNNIAQHQAIRALGAIGDPRAFDLLFSLYMSTNAQTDVEYRIALEFALEDLGNVIMPRLLEILQAGEIKQRTKAAHVLGCIESRESIVPLMDALNHTDSQVRAAAAFALGNIGNNSGKIDNPNAVKLLLPRLKDSDASVRAGTAYALGALEDQSTGQALLPLLHDEHLLVRSQCVIALGRLREQMAVELLIRLLKDEHLGVQHEAIHALASIGDLRAVEPIIILLEDPAEWVSVAAAAALGSFNDS